MTQPDLPEMYDRLTAKAQEWARANPNPPDFELSSSRTLSANDANGRVEVTMANFEIASIRVDDYWFNMSEPDLPTLEQAIREAVNVALKTYLTEEFEEAAEHAIPMGDLAAGLRELSVDFRAAYENAVARLDRHL